MLAFLLMSCRAVLGAGDADNLVSRRVRFRRAVPVDASDSDPELAMALLYQGTVRDK